MKLRILLLGGLVLAASCAPKAERPPPQQPVQQPVRQPAIPVPPRVEDWRDLPLTPGAWFYSSPADGSQALFGPANSEAYFIVRCDRAKRQIVLSREGVTSGNMMTVRTTSAARNFPLSVQTEPLQYVFATTGASDRFLDEIAFSRGRFTIQVPGMPMLVLPAWPEPARVIEDCRG
jgi:hypothetical protein